MKISSDPFHLAYVSPLNPIPSGVSDYSEVLLPALGDLAQVTIYSDCGTPSNPQIAERFIVRPVNALPDHRTEHDVCLYQLGNSAQHQPAFEQLRCRPGIVTLHEPFLHSGQRAISSAFYTREVGYEWGGAAETVLRRCAWENDRSKLMAFPLIARVTDMSLGLVVHSHTARRMIEANFAARSHTLRREALDITVIPHSMPLLPALDRAACRAALNLPGDALIFGVAGTINYTKEPEIVTQAFARLAVDLPDALLIFAGELAGGYPSLPELVRNLGLVDRVVFLGRVDPLDRLHQAIAACDAVINLRRPTIGETSGTALRAMALVRTLIVRNVGWYGELPVGTCAKLSATGGSEELAALLLSLGQSVEQRQALALKGRQYIVEECQPDSIAQRYVEFMQAIRDCIRARLWQSTAHSILQPEELSSTTNPQPKIVLPPGTLSAQGFQALVQAQALAAVSNRKLDTARRAGLFELKATRQR